MIKKRDDETHNDFIARTRDEFKKGNLDSTPKVRKGNPRWKKDTYKAVREGEVSW